MTGRSLHQTSASSESVSMSRCSAYTSAMIACDQNVYDPANSRPVNAALSVDCVMRAASHVRTPQAMAAAIADARFIPYAGSPPTAHTTRFPSAK